MGKSWKIIDLLKTVTEFLDQKGIENARLNAELLLGKVLNLKRVSLYVQFERPLSPAELDTYRELIRRRARHEPLQYILGETEFMGFMFKINSGILIPRPETEILVEQTLKLKNQFNKARPVIVDVGSGSGCIAVSLAKLWPQANIYATDVSETALSLIEENARLNNVEERIMPVKHDIFSDWSSELPQQMDILISNPPYIAKDEMKSLPKEIKEFEPRTALTDDNDGLSFYHRFFSLISDGIIITHYLLLELSGTQSKAIIELSKHYGLNQIEIIRDLNDIERVLKVKVIK